MRGSGIVLVKKSKVTACLFAEDPGQRLLEEVWIVTALFCFCCCLFFFPSPWSSASDANGQQEFDADLLKVMEQNCDGAETGIKKRKRKWTGASP